MGSHAPRTFGRQRGPLLRNRPGPRAGRVTQASAAKSRYPERPRVAGTNSKLEARNPKIRSIGGQLESFSNFVFWISSFGFSFRGRVRSVLFVSYLRYREEPLFLRWPSKRSPQNLMLRAGSVGADRVASAAVAAHR